MAPLALCSWSGTCGRPSDQGTWGERSVRDVCHETGNSRAAGRRHAARLSRRPVAAASARTRPRGPA
jgi:hypothetical protein